MGLQAEIPEATVATLGHKRKKGFSMKKSPDL